MFGATPDALLITEDGELLPVEIKSPWHTPLNHYDYVVDGKFVRKGDGNKYYFQLQLQILLCKVEQAILMTLSLTLFTLTAIFLF